jgi:FKBP-type peptidyl-prolyl cis-trans isomerase FklB
LSKLFPKGRISTSSNYQITKSLNLISLLLQKNIIMGIADKLFDLKNDKAAANLKAGQDFLEANKQKPGIVALPSGLQYEVITEGTGAKPLATNKVTCHYHGTLINGTIFDSSVQRGQPATFPLNMVIKGWTEGLQLMPLGSKWRFFIPADLGYGSRQVSAEIGANSTLIFEVELLGIS